MLKAFLLKLEIGKCVQEFLVYAIRQYKEMKDVRVEKEK